MIVCVSDESFDKEVINMEMLANGSIDGFIMALSSETQLKKDYNHLRQVTEQGIPLVLFDRVADEINCDKVVIDDRNAAYNAVKQMLEKGRRKIALITTNGYLNVSSSREKGYVQALAEYDIPIDERLILRLPFQFEDEALSDTFFASREVDGILSVNEIFAIRSMRILQENGKRVPEDVSVIGFTDGILSRLANPPLSSIAQHGEEMGAQAAELLISRVEAEWEDVNERYETRIIESTLVERGSTS